jgi:hypothetical protein
VTILGRGDLSPPRRPRRAGRIVAAGLVTALVAGAAYVGWRELRGNSASHPATLTAICTTPTPQPSPAAPRQVRLAIRNGTVTVGLAHQLADALKARGFTIVTVGNAPAPVSGVATVRYPAGGLAAARAVAEQIRGATLTPAPAIPKGRVQLDIGTGFRVLAPPAQVAAAHQADVAAAAPKRPECSTPTTRK